MHLPFRRRRPHPDDEEAREWVQAEINRLHAMSYADLLSLLDDPIHYKVESRTGRELMGETQVFWDSGKPGPLRVIVDICEPKPGIVLSIVSKDFIRATDDSSVDE
jgi:hypothetical protein